MDLYETGGSELCSRFMNLLLLFLIGIPTRVIFVRLSESHSDGDPTMLVELANVFDSGHVEIL